MNKYLIGGNCLVRYETTKPYKEFFKSKKHSVIVNPEILYDGTNSFVSTWQKRYKERILCMKAMDETVVLSMENESLAELTIEFEDDDAALLFFRIREGI